MMQTQNAANAKCMKMMSYANSTECNDNAHVKMHCNAGTNIECNTCRIRRIVHNASIVRTTTKCKIAIMLENVIENSKMIYNAL